MKKPTVYVASPYTKGDQCVNARFQMKVFDKMIDDGIVTPIAPLWSHFQHTAFPRPYTDWIEYDKEIIRRCADAMVRLDAKEPRMQYGDGEYFITESSGADGEVELMIALRRPVFYSFENLYRWARAGCPEMNP